MNAFSGLWIKLAKNKKYREEFVAAQVKRGIPFQIRALMKHQNLSQEELASRAGLTQGVVSRAANPNYGNLTLNTIIRIAAGFDVAFIGKFVPFSELDKWFVNLSEEATRVATFREENAAFLRADFEDNLATTVAPGILPSPFSREPARGMEANGQSGKANGSGKEGRERPERLPVGMSTSGLGAQSRGHAAA